MTRSTPAAAVALVLLSLAVPRVHAQTSILVGVGSTFPVGTLTSSGPFAGANAGWQGTIGLRRAIGTSGIAIGGRGFYGGNGYEGPGESESTLSGLAALGTWTLAQGPLSPLLWVEAGYFAHNYSSDSGGLLGGSTESSEQAVLLAGGLGASVPVGAAEILVLGGYSHAVSVFDSIRYFILTAALSLSLS